MFFMDNQAVFVHEKHQKIRFVDRKADFVHDEAEPHIGNKVF